jgi:outer membrane immunogenic protein
MKRLGILLSSALLLSTAAAQAADLNWNSAPQSNLYSSTPSASWSGFYAGLNAGYGWGTLETQAVGGGVRNQYNTGGAVLGIQGGYNMDMGGFVVGTEADLQWANVKHDTTVGAGKLSNSVDFFGTLRGRAGATFGQVMPYVTAGFAVGRGSASLDNGTVTSTTGATHIGWTAGLGLEAKATENISVKAEYLYVDLGTQTYTGLTGGNYDATQRFSVIRAGVNYKF